MSLRKINENAIKGIEYKKNVDPNISNTKLAEKFNFDRLIITKIEKYGYIEFAGEYYLLNDDIISLKKAIEEYKSDPIKNTVSNISLKYNINRSTLSKYLKKCGIEVLHRKINYDENIFETIDNEDKAYWLGFILADGSVYKDKELRIKLGSTDRDHLEKFKKFIGGDSDLKISESTHGITGNTLYQIVICSKKLVSCLKKYNIVSNKTMKEIPANNIPNEFVKDYIRGILDGDGCIQSNLKSISFVGSYDVMVYLKDKLSILHVYDVKIQTHGTIYKIQFNSKRDKQNIVKFLYSDMNCQTYLERKYKLAEEILKL